MSGSKRRKLLFLPRNAASLKEAPTAISGEKGRRVWGASHKSVVETNLPILGALTLHAGSILALEHAQDLRSVHFFSHSSSELVVAAGEVK